MIADALCVLGFAAGHMVRDGWPALGTTHGARALGAVLCGLGAFDPVVFAGVLCGFYTDSRHGAGQQARDKRDALWLAVSGVTSVAPLAVALCLYLWSPWPLALLAVGLVKPGIWFAAWTVRPDRWHPWLEPTRVAAITFGALIGLALTL